MGLSPSPAGLALTPRSSVRVGVSGRTAGTVRTGWCEENPTHLALDELWVKTSHAPRFFIAVKSA